MQRRLFVSFVVLVLVVTLSPSAFAQSRGGNSGGSHATAPRSNGGSRSAGRTASGGRSYGTSTPRTYDGSQRSYGYAGGRRSGYSSGYYGRSYARPFLGRLYYRRGDWYGYYGYGGLFNPIYDLLAWSRISAYANPVGSDSWMFNQPVNQPVNNINVYGNNVQSQVDDDVDYDQEEHDQPETLRPSAGEVRSNSVWYPNTSFDRKPSAPPAQSALVSQTPMSVVPRHPFFAEDSEKTALAKQLYGKCWTRDELLEQLKKYDLKMRDITSISRGATYLNVWQTPLLLTAKDGSLDQCPVPAGQERIFILPAGNGGVNALVKLEGNGQDTLPVTGDRMDWKSLGGSEGWIIGPKCDGRPCRMK